jgi:hypothetical protein
MAVELTVDRHAVPLLDCIRGKASGVAEMLSILPLISADSKSSRASGVAEMLSICSCV